MKHFRNNGEVIDDMTRQWKRLQDGTYGFASVRQPLIAAREEVKQQLAQEEIERKHRQLRPNYTPRDELPKVKQEPVIVFEPQDAYFDHTSPVWAKLKQIIEAEIQFVREQNDKLNLGVEDTAHNRGAINILKKLKRLPERIADRNEKHLLI